LAKYILDVPTEAQAKSNTCWHASALMIWRYWQGVTGRQGPMYSLDVNWSYNQPIQVPEFIVLSHRVGMKSIPTRNIYSDSDLESLLKRHGPLWCAGHWYGPGHIIVLAGIDCGVVHINDPDGGVKKKERLSWFNTKLDSQVKGALMAKDPNRY
jgi:ABC-type bacteriocin/lantibiotic exporter with double-glycine peptidase domain